MCSVSIKRAMYSEQVGADDQAAFEARGVGWDAGGESFSPGEAGYQDEAASDGAFFCQRDMVWLWSGAVEEALEGANSGILDCCDSEH